MLDNWFSRFINGNMDASSGHEAFLWILGGFIVGLVLAFLALWFLDWVARPKTKMLIKAVVVSTVGIVAILSLSIVWNVLPGAFTLPLIVSYIFSFNSLARY